VPTPGEPNDNFPGFAFANAMSSGTDLACSVGCTTSMFSSIESKLTATKSRKVS
jgi:hypothetical protein